VPSKGWLMMDRLLARRKGGLALCGVGLLALVAWGAFTPVTRADVLVEELTIEPPIELPVEINERVVEWMRRFQSGQRASFERFLSRGTAYSEMIERKLADRDMPPELLYLAMIESGFATDAMSPRSAVGMWQFMGPTAREYGLRVDRWVDERRDPVTATDAALDYLQWLHDRYDSWYLAAAAYNAGHPRVDRALRNHAGGREGEEALYWEIIEHLPRETREYVPRILAATILAKYHEAYGFEVQTRGAYEFDRVWVPGGTPLSRVAKVLDTRPEAIRALNPHLLLGVTPPGDAFALRVPVGTASQVIASLDGRGTGSRFSD